MGQPRRAGTGNFVGDTLAALGIGIWSWHGSPENVKSCPVAAKLFGVSAAEAWVGLPIERFAAGVHPEDRTNFEDQIKEAQQVGGPFVAQYRTINELGVTRSVLDRGEFELGPDGYAVAACGIVVDITDRPNGSEIEPIVLSGRDREHLPPLHEAVEYGLALHRLIGIFPKKKQYAAQVLIETLLEMLGREVSESLDRDVYWPAQQRGKIQ